MDPQKNLRHNGGLRSENALQRYAGALGETTAKSAQFHHLGASATMAGETPVSPQDIPMQGCHRFLRVKGLSPMRFDRLQDLSLLNEREEAQTFPPLRRDITYSLPIPHATQETEPDLWHPRNPSTIAARGLPPRQAFVGDASLPWQLLSRLNSSDTRILSGETEQLTEPFVRVEGTSEKYRFFPASEELPLSGLFHAPVSFSDGGRGQTALTIRQGKPPDASKDSDGRPLLPDPSGLPMEAPRPLRLSEQQVKTAPRASMKYAKDDITVYPGGISMDNVVDIQEKALYKSFEPMSKEATVENLMLDAARPGLKRGLIEQLQQPTEKQWRAQKEQMQADKSKAKKAQEEPASAAAPPTNTQDVAKSSGKKKVTFDLFNSSSVPSKSDTFPRLELEDSTANAMQQEHLLHILQKLQHEETHVPEGETGLEGTAAPRASEIYGHLGGDRSVSELLARCYSKLKGFKASKELESAELEPWNSETAPKTVGRPLRLLKDIEAMEARTLRRKEAKDDVSGSSQQTDDSTLWLPQQTEEPIALTFSQGLQSLRNGKRVRSPRTMPKAELLCMSRSLLTSHHDEGDDDFITEKDAAENLHANITETVEQPSYEIYHDTPTPAEDLVDTTPSLESLVHSFLPTTGYSHDVKKINYPAAIPSWVSRLSKCQSSKMAVPPAAAALYAMPKESGGPPLVKGMPTDPRSGTSQSTGISLAKLSAQEMRDIEELVAGGFVALQRQAERVDYRHLWEEEKMRLKMIVNEPICARDPMFLEQQKKLLSRWDYPANEISPGYYMKEANIEEERRRILAAKERRSIFDLQNTLQAMKEKVEQDTQKRKEEEEKEVENRRRAIKQKQLDSSVKKEESTKKEQETQKVAHEPVQSKKSDETESSPTLSLSAENKEAIERLKANYRNLRKKSKSEETEQEMKRIKREIAELTGRKKKKKPKDARRSALLVKDGEEARSTRLPNEESEHDQLRERIMKLLKVHQNQAQANLAKVLQGRGVVPESDEEEDEDEEEEEEEDEMPDETSSSTIEETISSTSTESFESIEVPVFVKSEYVALEYRSTPEKVEEWKKLPVDYCGRLLLETVQSDTGNGKKKKSRAKKKNGTESQEDSVSMFLLVEARGPALLLYIFSEPKPPKKRCSLAGLCKKPKVVDILEEQPKNWQYLCGIVIDNKAEVRCTTMENNLGLPYKAIQVCGRIVSEQDTVDPSEDEPSEPVLTKEQMALRKKDYFKGFLSADTETETEEWLAVLNGRKAFCQYVTACEAASQTPLEPVAASLWSPGPREIVLEGVPFENKIDKAIFSHIKLPYLDRLCFGWRVLDRDGLGTCLKNISCNVNNLDLSANAFDSTALNYLARNCQRLAVSQLYLAENELGGTDATAEGITGLLSTATPEFVDLRRTAITDVDCATIAAELNKTEQPEPVHKTVNLGENEITQGGLKDIMTAMSEKLPCFETVCVPDIPILAGDKLLTVSKGIPNLRQSQLSSSYPIYPFTSLFESNTPQRSLQLPAVMSGRLFVEVHDSTGFLAVVTEEPQMLLNFFELRGPMLLRYTVPSRLTSAPAAKGSQRRGHPRGELARAFGEGLEGMLVSSVKLAGEQLTVTGQKIVSNTMVSKDSKPETWLLMAESVDYLREWFRVLTIRIAGVACNTIARNLNEGLHPGVGQYCTSCFRRKLDLAGRTLAPGLLIPLFKAVVEDFRLKSVDMSNMRLDNELLQQLPKAVFAKTELTLLDLSFNALKAEKGIDTILAFCSSAKQCGCLVLDGNPLGDNDSAAVLVVKLMDYPISRICLNSCGFEEVFAEAVTKLLTKESKPLSFITSLELQSNAVSADSMKKMLDALVPRCAALKTVSLYGNGFDTIGRLEKPILTDFAKTHLDAPRRGVTRKRILQKKTQTNLIPHLSHASNPSHSSHSSHPSHPSHPSHSSYASHPSQSSHASHSSYSSSASHPLQSSHPSQSSHASSALSVNKSSSDGNGKIP